MTDDTKRLLVIIAIAILLALLLIFMVLFGGGRNEETGQYVPPLDIAGGGRGTGDIQGDAPAGESYIGQPTFGTPQESRSSSSWGNIFGIIGNPQGFSGPARSATTTYYEGGSGREPYSIPIMLSEIQSIFSLNTSPRPSVSTTDRERDGVTNPRPAVVWPGNDGIVRGGGNPSGGGRPDYEFDPITGNARIGDYYFAFAAGTIADASTSNYTGDPDNMVFGQAIGIFIGSLIGAPDIGLQLGTAIGSNLFPDYRLSDFGISVENGVPSFAGIGADGVVSAFGGDLGGLGGAAGGGTQYAGGYAIALPCTCSEPNFFWTITKAPKTEYVGTYLYTPDATLYEKYAFFGAFNSVISYESNDDECEIWVVEDCIPIPNIKGKLNDDPGTGTSDMFSI